MKEMLEGFTKFLVLLSSIYFFICSLSFLSTGFKITGGRNIGVFFEESSLLSNPVVGVMCGVLITVLVQSSSTSTSILVGLVGGGAPVSLVIPMVLGANIGTSVTSTVVAITQMGHKEQFRRSFSCATVHDMFNWLSVIVFTSLESTTHFLEKMTSYMVSNMNFNTSVSSPDMLKTITKPLINLVIQIDSEVLEGWAENRTEYENISTMLKPGCDDQRCNYLIAYIGSESAGLSDVYVGLILVIFSLVLMCGCLLIIVKILNSLIGGKVMSMIKKKVNSDLPYAPWLTGYVAIAVGAILTFFLQSSSVFTSTLTPLAGAGLVTLERAFPLTLGSNIGTTTTSILVRYLPLESPCEFGLEFQGSGVVTALTWRMRDSEPISPHKCKVLYQFIQNRTPVTFLFEMHGVSSSLSIPKDTGIAHLCPSLLIVERLLNFWKQLLIF